jgi:hypothetical protein
MVTIRTGSITDIEAVLGLWRETTDSSLTDDAGGVARPLARAPTRFYWPRITTCWSAQ